MPDTFNDTMSQDFLVQDKLALNAAENTIPGAVCWAIDSTGNPVLPPDTLGHRSILPDAQPMSKDTVFFLASTTKLVTAVAAMQCVERGLISLDDPVGKHLPEIDNAKVIEGWRQDENGKEEPILRQATSQVTLRQLLCHTSGVSASIFDPVYRKYNDWKGWPQRNPTTPELMAHPLRFDPGTKWIYGFGIDWAGILVGRLNNCTLGEYFQTNIFDPLKLTSTTLRPTKHPKIQDRLASITVRDKLGQLQPEPFNIWLKDSEEVEMDSGGYGLFSTAEDYISFLHTFILDDNPLLSKESMDEMFKPQLPSSEWLKANAVDSKGIVISGNIMFPESPVNHGLGFILAEEDLPTGCTAWAAEGGGLTNTFWWIDRKAGIAGVVFLNMLPYMDTEAVQLWKKFQAKTYSKLKER
ncbi:beta-lactamase [Mollisia scopiformis]|uniref:Beta-lactamase n=1 Tax=Mollisia scopiformis TaxID=149040 RepID=A0A194XFC4_MOLSC|nr:beta-lactamase [Mollisia scopiformis]KUJ18834.1 beta-lactamase [Mollisia scopiformis]